MVALLTPLDEHGGLDTAGLARLVDRVIAGGVNGICPVGSTGEGAHLSRAQRSEVVSAVRKHAGDDLPVIPGVIVSSATEALADAAAYREAGASALLVAPPFYYPLSQPEVLRFFRLMAAEAGLPVLVYNIPRFTHQTISPTTVGTLSGVEGMIGMKDSSGDLAYFQAVVTATGAWEGDGFAVLTGADSLALQCTWTGGSGIIAGSLNFSPALGTSIVSAAAGPPSGAPGALPMQRSLGRLIQACSSYRFPAVWKAALSLGSVCGPWMAEPAVALSEDETASLKRELVEIKRTSGDVAELWPDLGEAR